MTKVMIGFHTQRADCQTGIEQFNLRCRLGWNIPEDYLVKLARI